MVECIHAINRVPDVILDLALRQWSAWTDAPFFTFDPTNPFLVAFTLGVKGNKRRALGPDVLI